MSRLVTSIPAGFTWLLNWIEHPSLDNLNDNNEFSMEDNTDDIPDDATNNNELFIRILHKLIAKHYLHTTCCSVIAAKSHIESDFDLTTNLKLKAAHE